MQGRDTLPDQREAHGGLQETVVKVYRCAKVMRGGRRFSMAALVVVGDRGGRVGIGYGKAREVPDAVEKAVKEATADLIRVPLVGSTIPHEVMGRFGAARVFMKQASAGTGVIAGAAVRAVVEAAGIRDILTKSYGTSNPKNLLKATMNGLAQLRTKAQVAALRGVELD
jgi:small subunit ribosomal protein S5